MWLGYPAVRTNTRGKGCEGECSEGRRGGVRLASPPHEWVFFVTSGVDWCTTSATSSPSHNTQHTHTVTRVVVCSGQLTGTLPGTTVPGGESAGRREVSRPFLYSSRREPRRKPSSSFSKPHSLLLAAAFDGHGAPQCARTGGHDGGKHK